MRALRALIDLLPKPSLRNYYLGELPADLTPYPSFTRADWPPEIDFPSSFEDALSRYPAASRTASPRAPGPDSIASTPRNPPITVLSDEVSPLSSGPNALQLSGASLPRRHISEILKECEIRPEVAKKKNDAKPRPRSPTPEPEAAVGDAGSNAEEEADELEESQPPQSVPLSSLTFVYTD